MNKKICILNGSPRPGGNTKALIERFVKGAEAAENSVVCFDLQKMNIHGCLGCCKGGKDAASPCVQKDDMEQIYSAYRDADVVVLASPMYYWGISGQLKCAFDRLFAVAELTPNYENPRKDCVLLMAAEGDTESNFAPLRHSMKDSCQTCTGTASALCTPAATWTRARCVINLTSSRRLKRWADLSPDR